MKVQEIPKRQNRAVGVIWAANLSRDKPLCDIVEHYFLSIHKHYQGILMV